MSFHLTGRPSRRQAEEFARRLDGAPGTPDKAVDGLVGLASALRALPVGPRPEFQAALRQRLLAVAAVQPAAATATGPATTVLPRPARPVRTTRPASPLAELSARLGWTGQRRLAIASGAMAGLVTVAGIGVAGHRSLPGDALYGLKRSAESVELAATRGQEARGEKHLSFARERLSEVERLSERSNALGPLASSDLPAATTVPAIGGSLSSRVISALRDMDDETRAGTNDLTAVFRRTKDTAPLTKLLDFSREQRTRLSALVADLPRPAQPRAEDSLVLLNSVDARAGDLLSGGECTEACRPVPSPSPTSGPVPTPPSEQPVPCTCPTPEPATTEPEPEPSAGPSRSAEPTASPSPSPSPSPTASSLPDEIGDVVDDLPLPPVPTLPPLPEGPAPTPLPLPTISLP